MEAHGVEEFRKHLKFYWMVYFGLLVLTGVTVGVSYIHLPIHQAVALALLVATAKASLVALFFMHLNTEKKIIYGTLGVTGFCLVFLMLISAWL